MQEKEYWWQKHPWRMVQTNLRETDMADIDAAAFARDLKEFGATVVNLNAAGIVASYDTKLDFQPKSAYLTGDSLLRVVEECHAQGIRVIARTDFSRIRRDVYEAHPDWAARLADGSIIDYNGYVSVCPNSAYQEKYMFEVLREVFTTHPFDGLYCNMSSFYLMDYTGKFYGVCRCGTCKKLYKEETGRDMPETADPRDPALSDYMAFHARRSARHKAALKSFVKQLDPALAIDGVDFIRSEVNMDYGHPNEPYTASSNARIAAGPQRMRPSDNASVDFLGFRHRHISAPPALMALRQWQSLANSGCLSLYVIGRLDNHGDTSCFEPTKRAFAFHKAHEDLFRGLQSAAQVALLHAGSWKRMDDETKGWIRILTQSHIPFDELPLSELKDPSLLEGKRLVILPDVGRIAEVQAAMIDAFAEVGGTVLATGGTALAKGSVPLHCLGIASVQETRRGLRSSMLEIPKEQQALFPRCTHTPYLDFGEELVCVEPAPDAQSYLRLIPEHPFGPPECCRFTEREAIPGLLMTEIGKGRGIYLPWKGAAVYQKDGISNPACFLQDVLFGLCGLPEIAPGLTPMVELTLCKKDSMAVVQLINETGCFSGAWFDPVPVGNIRLVLPGVRGSAQALNGGTVQTRQTEDGLEIQLDQLSEYEAIVIKESDKGEHAL